MKRICLLIVLVMLGGIAIYVVAELLVNGDEKSRDECDTPPEQIEYGNLPDFKSEKDKQNWLTKLDTLGKNIRAKGLLDSYFHPNGPVISYGYDYSGYFVVTFEKCSKVEKSQMDEIYKIIKEEARKLGIYNVPVLFKFESFPAVDKG